MDEFTLARLAIAGDEEAKIKLLTLYKSAIYRVAYSYLKNEQDALDAVSETTYLALKNMKKLESPEYFKTWLVRIVINTSLQMKKKNERVVLINEMVEVAGEEKSLIEMTEMIERLPLEQQQLIYLKYFQDLKNSEIAEIQEISEGTVKSRLHHTLRRLRVIFKEGE